MPFEKGNKHGGGKQRPWRDALNIALKDGDGLALRKIAETCVNQAIKGDKDARREIAERLDGKIPQAVAGDEDNPIQVSFSARDTARAIEDLLRLAQIEGDTGT